MLAGLQGFCDRQGLDTPLKIEVIVALLCQEPAERAPSTKGTYHSVLRRLGEFTQPKDAPRFAGSLAFAPYEQRERAQLYSVAASQRYPWRRYSARMLLAFGLGAGLRPGELVAANGRDVTIDEAGASLRVRGARRRVVTLRGYEATLLAELVGPKNAYLFHPEQASRSHPNFVNDFCRQLVADPDAAKFSAPRARSNYICDHLAWGTPLSARRAFWRSNRCCATRATFTDAPQSKAALRCALAMERARATPRGYFAHQRRGNLLRRRRRRRQLCHDPPRYSRRPRCTMNQPVPGADTLENSRECFEEALGWLKGVEASALTPADIEDQLDRRGRELLRRMCQDHFNVRAVNEHRLDAVFATPRQ